MTTVTKFIISKLKTATPKLKFNLKFSEKIPGKS